MKSRCTPFIFELIEFAVPQLFYHFRIPYLYIVFYFLIQIIQPPQREYQVIWSKLKFCFIAFQTSLISIRRSAGL